MSHTTMNRPIRIAHGAQSYVRRCVEVGLDAFDAGDVGSAETNNSPPSTGMRTGGAVANSNLCRSIC